MTDLNESVSQKLDEILQRVESSKRDIEASVDSKLARLSEGFAQTSRDVQKFKAEKDYQWKREGNKLNYGFNNEIAEKVAQAQWALNYNKVEYAQEVLGEITDDIGKRNKLIKIADSSEAGWETVRQYVPNDLADDSEDDRRISRAEGRACRKLRASKRSRPYRIGGFGRGSWRGTASAATIGRDQMASAGGGLTESRFSSHPFRGSARAAFGRSGSCYHCGEFTHWRRDCPYINVNPQLPRGGGQGPSAAQ